MVQSLAREKFLDTSDIGGRKGQLLKLMQKIQARDIGE